MSTSNQTPAGQYVLATYNNQSKKKQLPCTDAEFLKSVEAAILLLDPNVNLDQFFDAIDKALVTDRELKSAGHPPVAFTNLPEQTIFKQAVNDAIRDQLLPILSKKKHETLNGVELITLEEPSDWAIIAERAAAVQEAMKKITDPLDRKIVRLRFFDPSCNTNVEVAKKIGRPPKFVGRRLEKILLMLRDELQHLEPN